MSKPNLVVILSGATSAGKSAVSMELFNLLGGNAEIVIADAVQVYNRLDIGANKPTVADQAEAPHHLINIADTSRVVDAAEYSRLAAVAISDIIRRGKVPIVVGGSTMWVQWLTQGIPDAPKADASVMEEAESLLALHQLRKDWEGGLEVLQRLDPHRARTLSRNDWYRLRRYLEVALSVNQDLDKERKNNSAAKANEASGADVSGCAAESLIGGEGATAVHKTLEGSRQILLEHLDLRTFFLCEERETLYNTIDNRCVAMLKAGLFEEVAILLRDGVFEVDHPATKAIGYRQAIGYLCDQRSFTSGNERTAAKQFVSEFATVTRNYAKRQLAWYRKDPHFLFLKINRAATAATSTAAALLSDAQVAAAAAADAGTTINRSETSGAAVAAQPDAPHQNRNTDKYAPYRRVAGEIVHWCTVSRPEFLQAIEGQILNARYVTNLRKMKNSHKVVNPEGSVSICSDVEKLVLQWMIHTGELAVDDALSSSSSTPIGTQKVHRAKDAEGGDSTSPDPFAVSVEDLVRSSPFRPAVARRAPPVNEPDAEQQQFSAVEVDIRVHAVHPKLNEKKKQYFNSRLTMAAAVASESKESDEDAELWNFVVNEATRWREFLLREAPDTVAYFQAATLATEAAGGDQGGKRAAPKAAAAELGEVGARASASLICSCGTVVKRGKSGEVSTSTAEQQNK